MKTLDKLNNGCYVLARTENIVLAYHSEANEFVTWLIDDDDTQQTVDGGYYSTLEDGIDCYFKRAKINASPSQKLKLKDYIYNLRFPVTMINLLEDA
tara:strand:- start:195 stop:485 length:291 start_codon:yes stop_codon:yes gene_type:complete